MDNKVTFKQFLLDLESVYEHDDCGGTWSVNDGQATLARINLDSQELLPVEHDEHDITFYTKDGGELKIASRGTHITKALEDGTFYYTFTYQNGMSVSLDFGIYSVGH